MAPVPLRRAPAQWRGAILSPATSDQIASLAAMDFEPWVRRPSDWIPPTNDAWPLLANPHLVILRLGFELLHKSKPELVATARADLRAATGIQERLRATHATFAQWAHVVGTAEARMLCTLATIQQGDAS